MRIRRTVDGWVLCVRVELVSGPWPSEGQGSDAAPDASGAL